MRTACLAGRPAGPSAPVPDPGAEWSKTYPAASALPLGVIELTLFVLYLVPKTRYLGGLVMLAYLGGAVATHVHAKDGMFFVPVIVGVVAWLGLYLRDRKLRALVPLVAD